MRASSSGRRSVGVVCALLLVLAALAGCDRWSDSGSAEPGAGPTSTQPSGYGAVFLAVDECSSFGTTSFTEVPCSSERAAARVIARYDGKVADGPLCPTTDFALHISETRPASDGDGVVPEGYAARSWRPPPRRSGRRRPAPRTIVGDCVYNSGDGQVRETACDGKGKKPPGLQGDLGGLSTAPSARRPQPSTSNWAAADRLGRARPCSRGADAAGGSYRGGRTGLRSQRAGSRSMSRWSSFASNFASGLAADGFSWTVAGATPAHSRMRAVARASCRGRGPRRWHRGSDRGR